MGLPARRSQHATLEKHTTGWPKPSEQCYQFSPFWSLISVVFSAFSFCKAASITLFLFNHFIILPIRSVLPYLVRTLRLANTSIIDILKTCQEIQKIYQRRCLVSVKETEVEKESCRWLCYKETTTRPNLPISRSVSTRTYNCDHINLIPCFRHSFSVYFSLEVVLLMICTINPRTSAIRKSLTTCKIVGGIMSSSL